MNRIHEAIVFAAIAHKGQVRKGTDIDYLSHPMEVLQILAAAGADENVQIAGILHDVVEDTPFEIEDIRKKFGDDVAYLVDSHTEPDKSLSWRKRKEKALEHLKSADGRVKQMVFADKLANIRSIASDFDALGDKLFERFNAGKEEIAWFYKASAECFLEYENDEVMDTLYSEFKTLYVKIFD